MLPAKLPAGKYLMEIEPSRDGADDLAGDSGAVGRMLVTGAVQLCQAGRQRARSFGRQAGNVLKALPDTSGRCTSWQGPVYVAAA